MSNINNDTDAINALASYVFTFGSAKGWPSDVQAQLSAEIYDAGTEYIDEYSDSLAVVEEWSSAGLPSYGDFVVVAARYAEELGIDYDVSWVDVLTGTVAGIASDAVEIGAYTRGAVQNTAERIEENPWLIPAVIGLAGAAFLWIKTKIW